MPGIPHKVKVGYRNYTIQPMQPEETEGGARYVGLHYGQSHIITINFTRDPPYPDSELHSTILHELLHAVLDVQGTPSFVSHKVEERMVEVISKGLSTLLRDNPHLITWLREAFCNEDDEHLSKNRLQIPSRIQCLPVSDEAVTNV